MRVKFSARPLATRSARAKAHVQQGKSGHWSDVTGAGAAVRYDGWRLRRILVRGALKDHADGRFSKSRTSASIERAHDPIRISMPRADSVSRSGSAMKPQTSRSMPLARMSSRVAWVVRSGFCRNSRAWLQGSITRSPSDFAKNGLRTAFLRVRATSTAIRCFRSAVGGAIDDISDPRENSARMTKPSACGPYLNLDQAYGVTPRTAWHAFRRQSGAVWIVKGAGGQLIWVKAVHRRYSRLQVFGFPLCAYRVCSGTSTGGVRISALSSGVDSSVCLGIWRCSCSA